MDYTNCPNYDKEKCDYITKSRWVAIEWTYPGEEIIDGMDGQFQVFVDDGSDEIWVADAHSLAEAELMAEAHNLIVSES